MTLIVTLVGVLVKRIGDVDNAMSDADARLGHVDGSVGQAVALVSDTGAAEMHAARLLVASSG
jgi:hypothetical protein